MLRPTLLPWIAVWAVGIAHAASAQDLLLTNGRIVTLNAAQPEAEALVCRDGRIAFVGSARDAEVVAAPGARRIDLKGRLAIPGFIESHAHLLGIGDAKMQLDLMHVKNFREIVDLVREAVAQAGPGVLIRGRGWHQEKWDETPEPNVDGLPLHDELSRVSPDNPVILVHASGHASFANAKAMQLAEIGSDTPDPPGGEIVRDETGQPIGMFRETAAALLAPVYEMAERPDPRQLVELAVEEALRKGITTLQDAGSSFATVDLLKRMADERALGIRLWVMLRVPNRLLRERMARYRLVGYGDDHLTVRAVKRAIDGALGPHGAWLLEPYSDLPQSSGLNTSSVEDIFETAKLCLEHDFQLCVHAIGDRANREVLDLYEAAFTSSIRGHGRDLRWRIEHVQHLHPDDIPRFARLGVIASMQGIHCTSDAPYVLERLGEERAAHGAYMWRALLDAGAVICNGTDAPVEDIDPIACFFATVTRELADGTRFFEGQRLTRMEALRTYTLDAAYAGFEEHRKGSLVPGKLADITVLSKDILEVPESEIRSARVAYTIVGGEVRYAADGAD